MNNAYAAVLLALLMGLNGCLALANGSDQPQMAEAPVGNASQSSSNDASNQIATAPCPENQVIDPEMQWFISHFVGGQRPTKEDGNAACDIDLASRQRQIAAIVSLGYLVEGIERVIAPPPGLGDVWVDAAIPAAGLRAMRSSLKRVEVRIGGIPMTMLIPVGTEPLPVEKFIFPAMKFYGSPYLTNLAQEDVTLVASFFDVTELRQLIAQYKMFGSPGCFRPGRETLSKSSLPNGSRSLYASQPGGGTKYGMLLSLVLGATDSARTNKSEIVPIYSMAFDDIDSPALRRSVGASDVFGRSPQNPSTGGLPKRQGGSSLDQAVQAMQDALQWKAIMDQRNAKIAQFQATQAAERQSRIQTANALLDKHTFQATPESNRAVPTSATSQPNLAVQNVAWDIGPKFFDSTKGTGFLEALRKYPDTLPAAKPYRELANELIAIKPSDSLPKNDPTRIRYQTAVRALQTSVAAASAGAMTLAQDAYNLSKYLAAYQQNPEGIAAIGGAVGPGFSRLVAIGYTLSDSDMLNNKPLGTGQRISNILGMLPHSSTAQDMRSLAETLSQIGYPRMDLVVAAASLRNSGANVIDTDAKLTRARERAPSFIEQTITNEPQNVAPWVNGLGDANIGLLRRNASIFANAIAYQDLRIRRNLDDPRISTKLSPDARNLIVHELELYRTIEKEYLAKAVQDQRYPFQLDNTLHGMERTLRRIYDFTTGLATSTVKPFYQASDVILAVWEKPEAVVNDFMNSISNPPQVAERVYRGYADLAYKMEHGNARERGEALGDFAINSLFMWQGLSGVSGTILDAAKSSTTLQKLGEVAKTTLERNPEFAQLLADESGAITIPGSKAPRPWSQISEADRAQIRTEIQNINRPGFWSPGTQGNAVENAARHFVDHRAEFPEYKSATEYVSATHDFVKSPPKDTLFKRLNWNYDIEMYDPKTNTFAVMDSNGVPRTMYRPIDGLRFWENRRGTPIDRDRALKVPEHDPK